jgi:hypothetical protein
LRAGQTPDLKGALGYFLVQLSSRGQPRRCSSSAGTPCIAAIAGHPQHLAPSSLQATLRFESLRLTAISKGKFGL